MSDPNDTDQAKRSALLDKISALLAKTQQNGCTEAEAIAAAELAQKLMGKYGLSLSELQTISSPADVCAPDGITIGKARAHEVLHLGSAIAFFTDCKSWYSTAGLIHLGKDRIRMHDRSAKSGCVVLVYFGLSADVAVAKYLTETLRNMLDFEWKAFWRVYPDTPKPSASKARASFMRAMTGRLRDRLYEMKADQSQSETNDCRQIVLVKADIVQDAYNVPSENQDSGVLHSVQVSQAGHLTLRHTMPETLPVNGYRSALERLTHDWPPRPARHHSSRNEALAKIRHLAAWCDCAVSGKKWRARSVSLGSTLRIPSGPATFSDFERITSGNACVLRVSFHWYRTFGDRIDFPKDQVTLLIYLVGGNGNRLARGGLIFQNLTSDNPA